MCARVVEHQLGRACQWLDGDDAGGGVGHRVAHARYNARRSSTAFLKAQSALAAPVRRSTLLRCWCHRGVRARAPFATGASTRSDTLEGKTGNCTNTQLSVGARTAAGRWLSGPQGLWERLCGRRWISDLADRIRSWRPQARDFSQRSGRLFARRRNLRGAFGRHGRSARANCTGGHRRLLGRCLERALVGGRLHGA